MSKCSRKACQAEIREGLECVHSHDQRVYCHKCALKINEYNPQNPPSLAHRVFVYRNLHKNCWSIKDLQTGIVVSHTKKVILRDVTFQVSELVRDRVRLTGRKEVHAGVVGYVSSVSACRTLPDWRDGIVTYNPYVNDYFQCQVSPAPPLTKRRGQLEWTADFADLDIDCPFAKVIAIWKKKANSGLAHAA